MDIIIDYNKCIALACLECLDICPMQVFDIENNKLIFDVEKCVGCLTCQDICEYDAIKLIY